MGILQRFSEAVQAVPVFAKVMGIALGLIALFGAGMFWQIREIPQSLLEQEIISGHDPAEIATIEEHVNCEAQLLTRRLARMMGWLGIAGLFAAWALARILTRPLYDLCDVTNRVRNGDYSARAPVRADDELGDLARALNEMIATLQEKEQTRQRLRRQVIDAGEEERKRLARELHDQSGQAITALIAGLSALESQTADSRSREQLAAQRALAEQTLKEIHDVALALRPSALDDIGLEPALRKHCDQFSRRAGVAVDFQAVGLDGNTRLSPVIETAFYRIVQEALTNALRHGKPQSVQVLVQRKDNAVLAVVEDDGKGFDSARWRDNGLPADRVGLLGIEERAALLGGEMRVESQAGEGTRLFVEIPLRTK